MKKLYGVLVLQMILAFRLHAQVSYMDSLRHLLTIEQPDTLLAQRLLVISASYIYYKPDTGLVYARKGLELSQKQNYATGEATSYYTIGSCLSQLGDFAGALSFGFKSLKKYQEINDLAGIIIATEGIGTHYRDQGDYIQALKYLLEANRLTKSLPANTSMPVLFVTLEKNIQLSFQNAEIGFCYITNNPDSAIYYATKAINDHPEWIYPVIVIADAYLTKKQYDSSLYHFRSGLGLAPISFPNDVADMYIGIAKTFKAIGKKDSCIFYAKKGLELCDSISYLKGVFGASEILASVYENIDPVKSIEYYKINKITGDSLFSKDKERQVQSFAFTAQLNQLELHQKLQQSQSQYKNRLNIYLLLAGLLILLIVAIGLWRKNIYKQKSFSILEEQKRQIGIQKNKAEQTLIDLQATQAQLIQSEKMASLGELTAGIAHEIQNPLNFVNNFSEVSRELIDELKSEKTKEKNERNDQLEMEILDDIDENLAKINHHGKRADAIVKGMLQHSQSSSGSREATNINALAEEYLRLSYHGLRAKDKNFNAAMNTDFDETIGRINIIPQDIGRALLNIYNNAFFAVNEKKKAADKELPTSQKLATLYLPTVSVSTKKTGNKVEIRVADNGNGIPQKIVDKIFQPFFTTKPTGQGTGLGLSLSYDIVKAHGGEIKVESKEGEGSVFIIRLLIS